MSERPLTDFVKPTDDDAVEEQGISLFEEYTETPLDIAHELIQATEATSYNRLYDKPQINGVELVGNKTSPEIHVQHEMDEITEQEIDNIIYA